MGRHSVREPRYVPPAPPTIGTQPDLFGGPPIVHEARRKPVPNSWGRQLLAYYLADHFADLEDPDETSSPPR